MLQYVSEGKRNLVVPYNVGVPMVYPMPTWSERVFVPQFYSTLSDQLLVGLTAAGIFLCLVLFAGLLRHWSSAVIRAATPLLCVLTMLGGLLLLLSNLVQTSVVDSRHCEANVWLLTVGFTLTFAPLFLKTFRIWSVTRDTQQTSACCMRFRCSLRREQVVALLHFPS